MLTPQQKAFSLIESAIVLAIVGLVIGGIWVGAAIVSDSLKKQQVVEGWAYYFRLVTEQFPKGSLASKNLTNLDIDEAIAKNNPPPAGWTVTPGGCCGVYRPVDPYGNRLYMQLQSGGGFSMRYNSQTISGSACRAVIDYDLFPKFLPVESRVLDVMNAS